MSSLCVHNIFMAFLSPTIFFSFGDRSVEGSGKITREQTPNAQGEVGLRGTWILWRKWFV